jgi:predicted dehydrogenase
MANGMSANLVCSLVTAVSYRLAAFGSRGCAELVTPELDFRFSATPEAMPAGRHAAAVPQVIENRGFNALLAELEAFAAAIRGEAPYPIPPEEVLHGVAAFEAIVQSAASGRPVPVARD